MNGYPGEERRQTTPIELRKVSNGAKWSMLTGVVSLVLMALALGVNLIVMARWTGRMETLMEVQIKDTVELKQDVRAVNGRLREHMEDDDG